MEKKITFSCGDCGTVVTTTEFYKNCRYCAACASDRNDQSRRDFAGEQALSTFYRLKDEGVF